MTDKEMLDKFLLGGSVIYQESLWSVLEVNSINYTYTLERLSDGQLKAEIKAKEVNDGDVLN